MLRDSRIQGKFFGRDLLFFGGDLLFFINKWNGVSVSLVHLTGRVVCVTFWTHSGHALALATGKLIVSDAGACHAIQRNFQPYRLQESFGSTLHLCSVISVLDLLPKYCWVSQSQYFVCLPLSLAYARLT